MFININTPQIISRPTQQKRLTKGFHISTHIANFLLTESEVVTGKSQTEASPYGPIRNDRTVEVMY